MWSGNRRSLGTFLHSPMLDELKSLEAMLMQRVTLFHPKQKDIMCSSCLCECRGYEGLPLAALLCHGVAVPRPDGDMAPVQL